MSKRFLVLVIFILLIVPLAGVNAQSLNGIDYCQHLSADDCAIINQSAELMADLDSFAFDLSLNYDIGMGEGAPGMEDISFNITGNGMLALNIGAYMDMQELAMSDPENYLDQVPALMDNMIAGLRGEASFLISLPEMMAMMTDGASEIPINLLMNDGVFALDFGALEGASGGGTGAPQWMGIDMNGAFSSLMDEMTGEFDFASIMSGDMMALNDPEYINDFVTASRLPDSEIGGEAVAVFQTTFDYGAMLESPEMLEALGDIYGNMGIGSEMTGDVMSMMSGFEFAINHAIGLDSNYTRRIDMTMNMGMDTSSMGDASMGDMALAFDFAIDLSNFNSPVDTTIPADAMVLPFEMLIGSAFGQQ